jgi:uncharacterized membrane protein
MANHPEISEKNTQAKSMPAKIKALRPRHTRINIRAVLRTANKSINDLSRNAHKSNPYALAF